MPSARFYTPIKIVSYVVLLLMLLAMGYSFVMAVTYWSGIGV